MANIHSQSGRGFLSIFFGLVVLILVGYIVGQALPIYVNFYRLQDTMREEAQGSRDKTDSEVIDNVLRTARDLRVPVSESQISFEHDGQHASMRAAYEVELWLVPNVYRMRWQMTPTAEVLIYQPPER